MDNEKKRSLPVWAENVLSGFLIVVLFLAIPLLCGLALAGLAYPIMLLAREFGII